MTTATGTATPTSATRLTGAMSPERKLAIATGLLFSITDVTSVVAMVLYQPVLNHPGFVLSNGAGNNRVLLGGLLEVILAAAVIGTAVTLYPVVQRHNRALAVGYVGLRTLEAAIIVTGIASLLAVVTLQHDLAGTTANGVGLATVGEALVAVHNWTFILGPGLVCGLNTTVMAYALYRSKLVARFIRVLGLIGGPLVFVANVALMFGVPRDDLGVLVVPVFAWEICLAIFLITKGFRSTAATPDVPVDEQQPQLTAAWGPLSLPPDLTPTPVPSPGSVPRSAALFDLIQMLDCE